METTQNNNGKLYAVRVDRTGKFRTENKGIYLSWCNENWYETTDDPTPRFTYRQARDMAEQAKAHYVSIVTLIDEDGVLDCINHLRRQRLFNFDIPMKKTLFSLNNNIFAKKMTMQKNKVLFNKK